MRICIVVDDYLPDSTKVTAKMMHELAQHFVANGHTITIVTPGVNLAHLFEMVELDRVKILRFSSGAIKNVSKFKRLINEILLPYRSWRVLKSYFESNVHDYIVYYSPSIFWFYLIQKLKRLWGAPAYLILRDLFPQWVIDSGLIKKYSVIGLFLRYCELKNYHAANSIGLQSPGNVRWFLKHNQKFRNVHVLYNWGSSSVFANPKKGKEETFRERLNLEKKIVFFYGGNIGHAQDMMNIIRLAERMQIFPNAHFLLVGAGDEYELVENAVAKEKISNVTLMSSVPQLEYKKMLSEFDIGLFTLNAKHQTHNFPGKIIEYMLQGKPILGSVNSGNDLQEVIHSGNAGFVSISGEDDLFFQNATLLLDKKTRDRVGKNSKRLLIQKFSVDSAVNTILNSYRSFDDFKMSRKL